MDIILSEKIGTIAPEIYGHFVENIGGVIYGGIWVGKDSEIPNVNGFRKDVVEKLRELEPSVLRWGGCFSETYNWRDGIGKNRPVRPSWWTFADGKYEKNEFGTHEFLEFCEIIGAKPYLSVNVTSLTPMDARNWIDYCLSPRGSTTLALEREKNGRAEPFNVPFWGIGNENWGGGGKMTAEHYADTYRRYAMTVGNVVGNGKLIAGACCAHTYEWAETFFDNISKVFGDRLPINGVSLHHYCSGGDAVKFGENEWKAMIDSAEKMDEFIKRHRAILKDHGREDLKLYIDEWGCMHNGGTDLSDGKYLYQQQSTIRDAVVTAYNLNLFNNNCDFVVMANAAQTVNCLHSLFLTKGEKCFLTPVYHVFDMFKTHQGGTCLRVLNEDPDVSVSASEKDNVITVTVANLSYSEDKELNVGISGDNGSFSFSDGVIICSDDPHDHNTFSEPQKVIPKRFTVDNSGKIRIPKASVVMVKIKKGISGKA